MVADKIDGKAISAELRAKIQEEITTLKIAHPRFQPKIVIIQVGDRPDSSTYVRMKLKSCADARIEGELVKYDAGISQKEMLEKLEGLNNDVSVHGILVQLPLPDQLDEEAITNAVKVEKDVDGFSELNIAAVFKKNSKLKLVPCTPKGIMYMLEHENVQLEGKNAVVCGRSDIVGGPMGKLLEKRGATVTTLHSKSTPEQFKFFLKNADIIVSAVGKAGFIHGDDVKPGCVIIDVGTNYIRDESKKSGQRMVGDVDYETCSQVASKITPVPGGVGPMTVVMVLSNLLQTAKQQSGL
ncbi:C-1-tetrahydrofolate synthase, mitochondrial [Pichia kudriavzevii]|uniref:C-1-tetrahydrofolate synthase, mitochondrial n=1 Tax=Pichia kudriavzevii TaxID=4909 RepID=A0A1V2LJ74_PICKU|nr:C-1-tetrahydrofolate synthase, mitochondrial [Pichia kudriavzevii]